jgi:hypothetical protein
VTIRSFGRVTGSAGREPGRAGHEPVRWRAEARQGGERPRPFRCFAHQTPRRGTPRRPCGGGRRGGVAIAGKQASPGVLIAAAAYFTARAGKAGAVVNSGLLRPPAFAGGGNYARVLPDCRGGWQAASCGGRSRRPARAAAGSGRRPAGPTPGGREPVLAAILMISRARCRGRPLPAGICPGRSDARHVFP